MKTHYDRLMAQTRWLTDEEQCAWRSVVAFCVLLPEGIARDLQDGHQLSAADYEILVRLSESPDRRMRMSELARTTLVSRSRLSHQITRMERHHLVRREECREDRRGWLAVLTEQGWDQLRAAAPDHVESVRQQFFDHLNAQEVASLGRICGKLVSQLQSQSASP